MALLVLGSVTSTMDVAREMLLAGEVVSLPDGQMEPSGIMALDQTEGRGQRGRSWYSEPGQSLCVTYYLPVPADEVSRAGQLAIIAGVAAVRALMSAVSVEKLHCAEDATPCNELNTMDLGLKWPNDLILNGKKLGGILIELSSSGKGTCSGGKVALVGVGINLGNRHFPAEHAGTSTSLAAEGFEPPGRLSLANCLHEFLLAEIENVRKYGFSRTICEWNVFDKTRGRKYSIAGLGADSFGVAVGVDSDGALNVQVEDGTVHKVLSAAVVSEAVRSTSRSDA